MFAALVIVFREVLEAGLIVGIVLAASRGVPGRNRAIALGIAAGVLGSMVVAGFATQISSAFDGRGQELFTAGVLALAVVMLTWHVAWMADHARELSAHLKDVGRAVMSGSQSVAALGIATAMAVLREGSEVVLFLSGIFLQHSEFDARSASRIGGRASARCRRLGRALFRALDHSAAPAFCRDRCSRHARCCRPRGRSRAPAFQRRPDCAGVQFSALGYELAVARGRRGGACAARDRRLQGSSGRAGIRGLRRNHLRHHLPVAEGQAGFGFAQAATAGGRLAGNLTAHSVPAWSHFIATNRCPLRRKMP